LLAILLDPQKVDTSHLRAFSEVADILLIGGSFGEHSADGLVEQLREVTSKPLVLFPGQVQQFTPKADALLFLSVLSSQNVEMLVGRQLQSARMVRESGIESIPMGYILVDGGGDSSVAKASHSSPIPSEDIDRIVDTAIMSELLGKQLVYLEAGSGALKPISTQTISAVRQRISVPLIVGGGICAPGQMRAAFGAGADIVVIGNHFELHPEQVHEFVIQK